MVLQRAVTTAARRERLGSEALLWPSRASAALFPDVGAPPCWPAAASHSLGPASSHSCSQSGDPPKAEERKPQSGGGTLSSSGDFPHANLTSVLPDSVDKELNAASYLRKRSAGRDGTKEEVETGRPTNWNSTTFSLPQIKKSSLEVTGQPN